MKTKVNRQPDTLPTLLALIVLFIAIAIAFTSAAHPPKSCAGKTKKGENCKSTFVVKGSDFCRLHQKDAVFCFDCNGKGFHHLVLFISLNSVVFFFFSLFPRRLVFVGSLLFSCSNSFQVRHP